MGSTTDQDAVLGVARISVPRRPLLAAVASLSADLDLSAVLNRIILVATELVDAQFGALGVLAPSRDRLDQFITVGVDDEVRERLGALPAGHGILGLLIKDPKPIRLANLHHHPSSAGWPDGHPPMTTFLGVPVFVRGEVYGNLYLTDKRGGVEFTDEDEELAVGLASAAAVAIENARLHERVRELALLEDRERIARELHDTVIQRLFATGLNLQGAARLAQRPEVAERIEAAVDELDATVRQVRTAIFELHAPSRVGGSLRREILAVATEAAGPLGQEPTVRFDGPIDTLVDDELAADVAAVCREGLANVARHAAAETVGLTVRADGQGVTVRIDDDGKGPGPRRPGGQGLGNLETRASRRGGRCTLEPRDGGGSRLTWHVPLTG